MAATAERYQYPLLYLDHIQNKPMLNPMVDVRNCAWISITH
jgi:hypothetical protein